MAELKRTFQGGKINRDLDDRLIPEGEYRDALNVGIGRSEGSDVGALETLKGNEMIDGQEDIDTSSVTIGTVRDPNNDRIYWFTKGDDVDGIYEYNLTSGAVNPILLDQVNNPLQKPTCVPDFVVPRQDIPSDDSMRPDLADLPTPPRGGCTDSTASNYDAGANYDDGSCAAFVDGCTDPAATNFNPNANRDDSSCVYTQLAVVITGAGTFQVGTGDITLTATASNARGNVSYAWSTGETTQTITISDDTVRTVTGSVTVTDSGRAAGSNTATANYSVTFTMIPVTIVDGCTDSTAANFNPNANRDDGSCFYTQLGLTISGAGTFQVGTGDITLTATASNALGTVSYAWSTGETTQTITIADDTVRTVTGSVTITDAGRPAGSNTATVNYSVTFTAIPVTVVDGCTDPAAANFNSNANRDDGSCVYTQLAVAITGAGTFQVESGDITLTATASNVLGTVSYAWSTGETTQTITISDDTVRTVTGSVTVTDSGRAAGANTATANYSVTFTAIPILRYTFNGTSAGNIANATISGGLTAEEGTMGTTEPISYTVMADPNDGFRWQTLPSAATTGLPSGVTQSAVTGVVGSEDAASVTISGTWDPIADVNAVTTFTGGAVEAVPAVQRFTGSVISPGIAASSTNRINCGFNISAQNVTMAPTAASVSINGTINGRPLTYSLTPVNPPTMNPLIVFDAPTGSLAVIFSGRMDVDSGVNNGGASFPTISPAGANTVIITSITVTLVGGSLTPTADSILPMSEVRFGVTGTVHNSLPATLVTP